MDFQVNTSDLEGIAGVFSSAGSDVAHLRAVLAGQGRPGVRRRDRQRWRGLEVR